MQVLLFASYPVTALLSLENTLSDFIHKSCNQTTTKTPYVHSPGSALISNV